MSAIVSEASAAAFWMQRQQVKWPATGVALDALRGEVRAVIASTTQPTYVSIWTRAR